MNHAFFHGKSRRFGLALSKKVAYFLSSETGAITYDLSGQLLCRIKSAHRFLHLCIGQSGPLLECPGDSMKQKGRCRCGVPDLASQKYCIPNRVNAANVVHNHFLREAAEIVVEGDARINKAAARREQEIQSFWLVLLDSFRAEVHETIGRLRSYVVVKCQINRHMKYN